MKNFMASTRSPSNWCRFFYHLVFWVDLVSSGGVHRKERKERIPKRHGWLLILEPKAQLGARPLTLFFFWLGGFPKIDDRKESGTLILTSLLEDLANMPAMVWLFGVGLERKERIL